MIISGFVWEMWSRKKHNNNIHYYKLQVFFSICACTMCLIKIGTEIKATLGKMVLRGRNQLKIGVI